MRINKLKAALYIPPPVLCTDNAASIASFAFFCGEKKSWEKVEANADMEVEVS